MKTQQLILENDNGQAARVMHWSSDDIFVVNRLDTKRLEFYSDLSQLQKNKIPYSLIAETGIKDLQKKSLKINGTHSLRVADEIADVKSEVAIQNDESAKRFPVVLKRTAATHAILLLLIFFTGWLIQKYFTKSQEPVVVTVFKQNRQEQKTKIVEVSQKKIVKTKRIKQNFASL